MSTARNISAACLENILKHFVYACCHIYCVFDFRSAKNILTRAATVLGEFIDRTEGIIHSIKKEFEEAKEAYEKAVTYYGEQPSQTSPQTFFGTFLRFISSYKKAAEVTYAYI